MPAQPHIAVLGAAPGGYVAAIRASQLGAHQATLAEGLMEAAEDAEDKVIHHLKEKVV